MNISPAQFELIQVDSDHQFAIAINRYLADRFRLTERPGFDTNVLTQEVRDILIHAKELNLSRYDGYALHVIASFVLGVDYHIAPSVKPILHSKSIAGDLKTLWLERWLNSVENATTGNHKQ
jgi:hypothetical protein